jgi:hypothetical protein
MTIESIEGQQPPEAALAFAPASPALVDLLSQDDAVVDGVAEILRLDPDLVACILRLANLHAFGFERQVRHLAHAVAILGTHRVKALIAAGHSRHEFEACWRHSVASAFLASELPGAVSDLEPLLLRVPESAKVRSDPARMARLLEKAIAYINN